MATVAYSTGYKAPVAESGLAHKVVMTLTPGTTVTAGEDVSFVGKFSTIDAIKVCGVSAVALAAYMPVFVFTPGGAVAADSVQLLMMVQDGDAGPLVPSNGDDLSAAGTIQIEVSGKLA